MPVSFLCRWGFVTFTALAFVSGTSPVIAGWDVKPDPPGKPLQLAVKPGMALPLPNPPGLWPLFATTPSPFVAVGQNNAATDVREVWDLQTFQRTGSIKGKLGSTQMSPMRLSPDGKFLAVTATDSDPDRAVEVWSFADGKLARRLEPKPRPKKILGFDFANDGRVVIVIEAEVAKLLQIYDVNTGSVVATHGLPASFQENSLAFSPGRKYVAYLTDAELRVVELEKGKLVGSQAAKGLCNGMAFSPDGTELAGLFFGAPGGRLIVWDLAKGEVVVEHALPSGPTFKTPGWGDAGARSIDWLPDGSAWLLAGHALVNRKDGRWVWNVFAPAYKDANGKMMSNALIYSQAVRLLDNDHALAALKARTGGRLEVVDLPWPQIDASLKALESNTPALLRAGGSLSLKFNIGSVRFSSAKEVEDGLTEAIRDGLAAEGITVADGQPVVLQVKYAEEPGPPYRIVGPGNSGNSSVTSTKFTTDLALMVPGVRGPVWTDQKFETGLGHYTTSRSTGGRVDEAGMRAGGFEGVKNSVKSLGLPYFIPRPQDKNLALLPGTTVLAASATPTRTSETNPNNTKLDKPTQRGQSKGSTKKP
jgi:hypothetical protein